VSSRPESEQLPKLDFSLFVISIIHSAHVHLGETPGPDGQSDQNLELAHQDIELLTLLEEKTKGNLTGEEERILHHALVELREKLGEATKGS